jgi:uncharacterized protein (TIGR00299 family) protein
MFLGALVDTGAPIEVMQEAVQAVAGDCLTLEPKEVRRAGIRGMHVEVRVNGEKIVESGGPFVTDSGGASSGGSSPHGSNEHRTYSGIVEMIEGAKLASPIRDAALRVFHLLGEAESTIHGVALDHVHFHEVGSLDAVADVVGTAAGIDALGLTSLYHGPVAVGGGTVNAAHGTLPVPAPATLVLLRGRPCVVEPEAGELTTPTGAALLAALTQPVPTGVVLQPTATGYGAGTKDPEGRPNLARLMLSEMTGRDKETGPRHTRVAVVETSLDDCTPEEGGHLLQALLDLGALDVTISPLIMKKGRPGFLLRVIAPEEAGSRFAGHVVRLSSSLGARWRLEDRLELDRRVDLVTLPDGEVRVKVAVLPDGSERVHPEYDDLAALAGKRGLPISRVRAEVEQVWNATR